MGTEAPVDYDGLSELLKALANPVRLELLDTLRFPRMVGEIRVAPARLEHGDNPARPAARQTLQAHLDRLVAADLVRDEKVQVGERSVRRYAINSPRLYVVTEELRRLVVRHAARGGDAEQTQTLHGEAAAAARPAGPRLVLVHGVYEGKSFLLDPKLADDGRWTIGRKRGLPVTLDYDPFVSNENSIVAHDGESYTITDVPGSRNGTRLNWEPLTPGIATPIAPGDVIGVGRSLLVLATK